MRKGWHKQDIVWGGRMNSIHSRASTKIDKTEKQTYYNMRYITIVTEGESVHATKDQSHRKHDR